MGRDGACKSLYKATRPATWFLGSRSSFCCMLHTFLSVQLSLNRQLYLCMEVSSFLPFSYFNTLGIWFQDRGGCTVEDFCNHIHRSLVKEVKYVLVWGISARHYPQHCGLSHLLQDEDVVQIVKKKVQTIIILFNSLIWKCIYLTNIHGCFVVILEQETSLIETPCNPQP